MEEANPYAPPKAVVKDVTAMEAAPPLWNPGAAASWSLLFSPIFGSILHMKNWQAMGDEAMAASSRRWAIGSVAFFAIYLLLSMVLPESKAMDTAGRAGGLALLLAWYFSIAKRQSAQVLARYGKTYPRRGWGKPLLLGVLGYVGVIVAAIVVGVAIGITQGAA